MNIPSKNIPGGIRVRSAALYLLPLRTRMPLKFGNETVTEVVCARVRLEVVNQQAQTAEGWGETPLSVQWVWPSAVSFQERQSALIDFCRKLTAESFRLPEAAHPMESSADFQEQILPTLLGDFNHARPGSDPMPWLAALVCFSPFDLALHDAYGKLHERPLFELFKPPFLTRPLSRFLTPLPGSAVSFENRFPADYLAADPPQKLRAWHLVGGLDPLASEELTGNEPRDDFPVLLEEWIRTDGLKCLKVKLRGNDAEWDYQRLVSVGQIGSENGVEWLSADFNCTVREPEYVNFILDRLRDEHPRFYGMLLYVEQPFPYDLERNRIDAHSLSARKPLFLDESAHDWRMVRLGRELGWSGVALKTCKTLTGALLSACWARAHGMTLMVQDLTNPMLAQIPHLLLASHTGTIMGVETNSMQFYPEASAPEAFVHPGVYRRREGMVDLSSLRGPGFGYRLDEISRQLPEPAAEA